MKRTPGLSVLLTILVALLAAPMGVRAGDMPATAQELALRVIEAHGGMEKWKAVPTFTFTSILFDPQKPPTMDLWWVHTATVEQGSRRLYQEWPVDGARLVFDGKNYWTTGWKRGNPPRFMAHISFFFMNLPWLTQDSSVRLEGPGRKALRDKEGEQLTLRMTFESSPEEEYYLIYIDPKTYLVSGLEYTITDAGLMDAFRMPLETKFMGPVTHTFDEHITVDGLTFLKRYHTYSAREKLMGMHVVYGISLREPFDESKLEMPAQAVIDDSNPRVRKSQRTNSP
jgi:hypothetical protein